MSDIPESAVRVVASYDALEDARRAVEALEEQGVDGGRIRLEGALAATADDAAIRDQNRGRDEVMTKRITGTIVGGALAGMAVGALLGAVAAVTLWGTAVLGPPPGAGLWAFALGLGAAGAGVGVAVSGYARMKQSGAWEAAQEPVAGADEARQSVQVAVYASEPNEVSLAEAVLRDRGGRDTKVLRS